MCSLWPAPFCYLCVSVRILCVLKIVCGWESKTLLLPYACCGLHFIDSAACVLSFDHSTPLHILYIYMIVTQWSLWVRTSQFYIFNSFSCSLALQVGYGAILFRFLLHCSSVLIFFCVYQLPPNHAFVRGMCALHVCVCSQKFVLDCVLSVCLWWAVCSNLEKHHIKEYIIVIIFTTTTTMYVLLSFAFHSSSFIFPKYVIYPFFKLKWHLQGSHIEYWHPRCWQQLSVSRVSHSDSMLGCCWFV